MGHTSITQLFSSQQTSSLLKPLVVGVISLIVAWYMQYLWQRRKLYLSSIQLPGPLSLPIFGSAFSFIGNSTQILDKMFNIYPGIFRIWFGPKMIYAVTDPRYIEILMISPHALGRAFMYRLAEPITGAGLFTAPVSRWRKTRKIIHPTFNQKILDTFVDIFVKQSKIFVEVIQNKYVGRGEVDIHTSMSRFTLDSIIETAMGIEIKAQTTDSDVPLWLERLFEIGILRILNIFYHSDFIFGHSALGKEGLRLKNNLKLFGKEVITKKRTQYEKKINSHTNEDASKIKPFLDLLLEKNCETENGNNLFSDDELIDETINLMIGGTDTTASSNCSVLTMLGMHQDIQEKVLAEVLEVVGPDRDVHFSDLPKLKYLERVIKETVRLMPVAAFIGRDVDENIDLGDLVIQKGTTVVFGMLKVQRDENYWPDPLKFNPDRFLPEEVAKRPPGCYIPFSYGPRSCIGIRYAMMSMKTLLATTLRKYKIYTSYKEVSDIELKITMMLRPTDGYKITLELRN